MKLVKLPSDSTSYWLPTFAPQPGGRRGLFSPGQYETPRGRIISSCLGCVDAPCRLFTEDEICAPVAVDTPVYPDRSVCPVDALMMVGESGIPEVDDGLCIGCGLCVTRCPVGAIHLDPENAVAVVAEPHEPQCELVELTLEEFFAKRKSLEAGLLREPGPFTDSSHVTAQLKRIGENVVPGEEQRTFRLLARNAFLALGYPSRLKNPGDNNAFAELVGGDANSLILLEIEPGGDTLDAFRRSLSGVAVAMSRYKVPLDRILAGVVLDHLPNVRVDYYEAVKNAASRIGVVLRSLPVAVLLLSIRSADDRLLQFLRHAAVADSDNRSLEADVEQLWGAAPGAGLSPEK